MWLNHWVSTGNHAASNPKVVFFSIYNWKHIITVITTYNCRQMASVRGKIENVAASDATKLDLCGCKLTEIPLKVFELTSLQELYLHRNQLTTLPPEIGRLTSLQVLNLYNNQFTTLPPEIGKLTSLRELYLHDNQLTTLPPEIDNLTSLRELRLDNNQLTTLPASLVSFTSMRRLGLRNNPITHIPSILIFHPYIRREFIIMNNQPWPTSPQDYHSTTQVRPLQWLNNTVFTIIPKDVCDLITEYLPAITLQVTLK
jgi:Leucine-rich repeat (LRR) protein